jgi:hypothetical protein
LFRLLFRKAKLVLQVSDCAMEPRKSKPSIRTKRLTELSFVIDIRTKVFGNDETGEIATFSVQQISGLAGHLTSVL